MAPDSFRVASSQNRLVQRANGKVTFRYQESKTGKSCYTTVAAEEFIRRWLQHGLPERCITVRDYELFAPTHRQQLDKARKLLGSWPQGTQTASPGSEVKERAKMPRGPKCGRLLILVQTLQPQTRQPP